MSNEMGLHHDSPLARQLTLARQAAQRLAGLAPGVKAKALEAIAEAVAEATPGLIEANRQDFEAAQAKALPMEVLDRLVVDRKKIDQLVSSLRRIAAEPDPVGEYEEVRRLPTGLEVARVRAPLGVVAVCYESRPLLAADAMGLALKAGNAVVLELGREAPLTLGTLAETVSGAGIVAGLPMGFLETLDSSSPGSLSVILAEDELLDAVICRGGEEYTNRIRDASRVPVLFHGQGFCHIYVDDDVDQDEAIGIIESSKLPLPNAANAVDCVLIHREIAREFLPKLAARLQPQEVTFRGGRAAGPLMFELRVDGEDAGEAAYHSASREFGRRELSVEVVDDLDGALLHISRYGTGHTEAICTRSRRAARRFQREVDAACVGVNASTRLHDGLSLGLGLRLGISTEKMHARGPITARSLTTTRLLLEGDGHLA